MMQRSIIFFGILFGILLIIYVRLLDVSEVIYSDGWGRYLGYLAVLILPLSIFFTLRQIRLHSGPTSFFRTVSIAAQVAIIASTVYCVYMWSDIQFFNASHLENTFKYEALEMKLAGHSDEDVSSRLKKLKEHYFSASPYINTYTMYLAMGLVYGCLFHLFFRIKKSNQ